VGVLGSHGRGLADEQHVADRIEIQMGTLGKALGAAGAYVCGRRDLRDYLINSARSFIFSTAPAPGVAAAASAAVGLLDSTEGEKLVRRLADVRSKLARLLGQESSPSAVFPISIGDERRAVAVSHRLREDGFWVPAVRFPTVAKGSARLRATVTAGHTDDQLEKLADALQTAIREA
jgi:glycine C-acetyltransferase/8-amino-7-oxononanoate synthase